MSELIHMIMRQTNYDENEAQNKLKLHGNDAMKVIEAYMGITPKKEDAIKSVNQEKYKQFRTLMDTAAENYRKTQHLRK